MICVKAAGERMRFKLVTLDVDGTLLDSSNRLRFDALEAIRAVRARGIRVTLSSGRSDLALSPLVRYLGIDQPYIGAGGSFIMDPVQGCVLERHPLDIAQVTRIVQLGRAMESGVVLHGVREMLCEVNEQDWAWIKSWEWIRGQGVGGITRVGDILSRGCREVVRVDLIGPTGVLREVAERITRSVGSLNMQVVGRHLEVTLPGIHKGQGLKRLATHLGIPLTETLAIGDDVNDASMLAVAGFAVAMGNACPELKAVADLVAPTNDEGGLAWALENVVLGGAGQ